VLRAAAAAWIFFLSLATCMHTCWMFVRALLPQEKKQKEKSSRYFSFPSRLMKKCRASKSKNKSIQRIVRFLGGLLVEGLGGDGGKGEGCLFSPPLPCLALPRSCCCDATRKINITWFIWRHPLHLRCSDKTNTLPSGVCHPRLLCIVHLCPANVFHCSRR